ncbi:MAG: SURF1 family protein [Streptosporangiales bacterium]|nr:SURF1 family protein [Streptosporangiales bacterium]
MLTRRWLGLTALVLVLVPAFIGLGRWQLSRHYEKQESIALLDRNAAAAPADVRAVATVGEPISRDVRWRRVSATGTYDPAHELLVRNRSLDGNPGLYVITPLVTEDGRVVVVNRGWVENPPTATTRPRVPPPPAGTVTVRGRLMPGEPAPDRDTTGLPAGQILTIDVPAIARTAGRPAYGGYVELTEQTPAPAAAPRALPAPERDYGPHLAYAVQWWLFALIAVGGWVFLLRKEYREEHAPRGQDARTQQNTAVPGT